MYSCNNEMGGIIYTYDYAQALKDRVVCSY
jgi:superfamily II DNA or RNA helicase